MKEVCQGGHNPQVENHLSRMISSLEQVKRAQRNFDTNPGETEQLASELEDTEQPGQEQRKKDVNQ